MRLTWTKMQMLDFLYSPSVLTMVMKVGHVKKMQIFVEVRSWHCEMQSLPVLRSAEASFSHSKASFHFSVLFDPVLP